MISDDPGPAPIEAIDRAMLLLSALGEAGHEGRSLADLSRTLGMNKSTAYRALMTMLRRDFVTQTAHGTYTIGPAAALLSVSYFATDSIVAMMRPALIDLSSTLGELVHLGTLNGARVMYVDKIEPERHIRVWSQIGRSMPAATTAMGRATLAFMEIPDDQFDIFATRSVTATRLRTLVRNATAKGYATELEENEPGVACIGVPILAGGTPRAAFSVSVISTSLTDARKNEILDAITEIMPKRMPEPLSLPKQLVG